MSWHKGKTMQDSKTVWAVGLMSGTSLDGIDGAMLHTDGQDIFAFGPSHYRPYAPHERAILKAALGQWHGGAGVAEAEGVLHRAHMEVLEVLSPTADLVGFHGQTLAHDVLTGRTHQAGRGDTLASDTGLTVVWDFRSADMAFGGQGAPLAPIFHWALARWAGVQGPHAILNLGGVGNITWLNPDTPPEDSLLAFDIGPANAPINDLVQARMGLDFDANGDLARSGTVIDAVVQDFLCNPWFQTPPPKALDRDAFAGLVEAVAAHTTPDATATLVEACVQSVLQTQQHLPAPPTCIWVTGGGRKNTYLMERLGQVLPVPVADIDAWGVDGDMIEAFAFAYLAVRVKNRLPTSYPRTTGVKMSVSGGMVSSPE